MAESRTDKGCVEDARKAVQDEKMVISFYEQ